MFVIARVRDQWIFVISRIGLKAFRLLGPIYTEHQRQRGDEARAAGLIETTEVVQKWVATLF